MNEEWKPIDWHPDLPIDKYSISNFGRIRNNYTNTIRKNTKRKNGTVVCMVSNSPKGRRKKMIHYTLLTESYSPSYRYKNVFITLSIAVAKAFLPPPTTNPEYRIEVGFKDGDISNVNAENLEWKYILRSEYHDSKIPDNRKLSEEDVRKICMMLVEENGKITNICLRLNKEVPNATLRQVTDIKYKHHYASISDEYFDYYDRKFIPNKK